jgi:hypothetical protein
MELNLGNSISLVELNFGEFGFQFIYTFYNFHHFCEIVAAKTTEVTDLFLKLDLKETELDHESDSSS